MGKSVKIGALIPVNLLNNPQASCSLMNYDFLLSHTVHFDKYIIISFFLHVIKFFHHIIY